MAIVSFPVHAKYSSPVPVCETPAQVVHIHLAAASLSQSISDW